MAAKKPRPATDLEVLQGRVMVLERHVTNMAEHFTTVAEEIKWVRKRLASLLPERHYCPYCKATIHKDAKACGACGRSWGRSTGGTGLPT